MTERGHCRRTSPEQEIAGKMDLNNPCFKESMRTVCNPRVTECGKTVSECVCTVYFGEIVIGNSGLLEFKIG